MGYASERYGGASKMAGKGLRNLLSDQLKFLSLGATELIALDHQITRITHGVSKYARGVWF